jgi:hypothetical protein
VDATVQHPVHPLVVAGCGGATTKTTTRGCPLSKGDVARGIVSWRGSLPQ